MAKKQAKGRRTAKCDICGDVFAGERYLKQHKASKHNNNNNNNNEILGGQDNKIECRLCHKILSKKNIAAHKGKCHGIRQREEERKEKKSFIYFLNFLIKYIMIYNKRVDIANMLGDDNDKRRHLYLLNKNNNKDDDSSSCNPAPEEKSESSLSSKTQKKENEDDNNDNDNNNDDNKVGILSEYFRKLKKEEVKKDNKKLREYFDIKHTRINHNEIKKIMKIKKEELINKINEFNDNKDLKYNDGESDLFLEYVKDFAFTKISCRQIIRNATNNAEIIAKADRIINKKINDYPTDEEIRKKDEKIINWLATNRNNNIYFNDMAEEFKLMTQNFFKKIRNNQCSYCLKFTFNKKRHLFQCKKFKNSFGNNKGAMLIQYLKICVPFMKPEIVNSIALYLRDKDLDFIYKNTRGLLKFGLLKKIKEEEEKKKEEEEKKKKEIKKKDFLADILKDL